MAKKDKKLEPCSRKDGENCFANKDGLCTILTKTDEFKRPCPFYKTKAQYESELPKKIKRNKKLNINTLNREKKEAVKAANKLGYPNECVDQIIAAENSIEIQNIMHDWRLKS